MNERAITIEQWRRKRGHNPRYSVYDGREQLGSIFESKACSPPSPPPATWSPQAPQFRSRLMR
jgi:hypothetical protein